MSENRISPMSLTEFFKLRTQFEAAARARREERQNRGDDTPYQFAILEEMFMFLYSQYAPLVAEVDKLRTMLGLDGKE